MPSYWEEPRIVGDRYYYRCPTIGCDIAALSSYRKAGGLKYERCGHKMIRGSRDNTWGNAGGGGSSESAKEKSEQEKEKEREDSTATKPT